MPERRRKKQTIVRIHTRKVDRAVAKYMMKRAGRTQITSNKRNRYKTKKHPTYGGTADNTHYSYFAQNWRVWAS